MLSLKEKTSVAGETLLVNIGVIKPRPFCMRQGQNCSIELKTLAESIAQHGVLQPLIVRRLLDDLEGYKYELVAGERRYLAAFMANFGEIPVMVCELDEREAFMVSLVENLQRENLNPIEETEGILKLLSLHLELDIEQVKSLLYKICNCRAGKVPESAVDLRQLEIVDQLFDQLGCFTLNTFVQVRLSLLNLLPELKKAIVDGLSYTKAKELNRISDDQQRQDLLQQVQDEDLSFRETKKLVQSVLEDCDEGDERDLASDIDEQVWDSQSDVDEQVSDSQDDIDKQVSDSQSDIDEQVSDSQDDFDEQVWDSQSDVDEQVSDFQSDRDEQVSGSQDDRDEQVSDFQDDRDEQVSDCQGVRSDRVSDSQGNMNSEVFDSQDVKSDRVTDSQDDVSDRVMADDEHGSWPSQVSDSQGETLSDKVVDRAIDVAEVIDRVVIDRVIDVVNELETFTYEVVALKLESDDQEKLLYLLEKLKQLVGAYG